jgi:hypothetical protein
MAKSLCRWKGDSFKGIPQIELRHVGQFMVLQ